MASGTLSIGGKIDSSNFLKGAISALEIYVGDKTRENHVPDALKYLIINSQLIKTKPPVKKK